MAVLKYKDPTSGEWKKLSMNVGDTVPIGTVVEFASDNIPDNWLLCDGRAVSRTTYSELFSVLGTTWGSGDGSTTFNLPSKLGLVTVGKNTNDTDFSTLNKKSGNKTTTLSTDNLPAHSHSLNSHTHTYDKSSTTTGSHTLTINEIPSHNHFNFSNTNGFATHCVDHSWGDYVVLPKGSEGEVYNYQKPTSQGGGQGHTHNITLTSTNTGAASGSTGNGPGTSTAFSNMPPYVTSNFIIKAKQSSGLVADVVDNLTSTNTTNALSAKQGKVLNDTKLSLTGGTLTGDLYRKCTEVDLSLANNNITTDDKFYPTQCDIRDKNMRIMTRLEGIPRSSGEVQSFWYVRNYNTSGTMTRSSRY